MSTRDDVPIRNRRKGKSYLLVIGIDEYPHFKKLNNAVRDAETFYKLMLDQYQFDEANATLLINDRATYHNIDNQLEHLIDATTEEDEVVLYFSGHGSYHESREMGYWLPYDAQPGNRQSLFANTTLVAALKPIKAKHILIISDSCWSGSLISNTRATTATERLSSIPSRWILTSGRKEVVEDGPPGTHSPLAFSLLNLLNTSEHNAIRLSQVAPTILDSVAANANQLPLYEPIRDLGHGGGEMMFLKKGASVESIPIVDPAKPIVTISSSNTPPPVKDPTMDKSQLKELFMMGDYDKGFAALREMTPKIEENTYYLLRSQYSDYRSAKSSGIRSDDQLDLIKRRLNNRILGFIDDL